MLINALYLRAETYPNEFRTPIIPIHISVLISIGFKVYVQSSAYRCYTDTEYEIKGAIVVNDDWYHYPNCFIIGIKELQYIEKLCCHTHIYFSHTYKNQTRSQYILYQFKKSNSILYDLEYFVYNNKRLIAFGHYAGITGCALGLLQYFYKKQNILLQNLTCWKSIDELLTLLQAVVINKNIKIALIGPDGRCGVGVKFVLDRLGILYERFYHYRTKSFLEKNDIIYNCINLTEDIGVWFDQNTPFCKDIVITDISCDYNNPYNPIKLYHKNTTWDQPVFSYNNYVDIIAIDNLPSLLPIESSIEFSEKLLSILQNYKDDSFGYWMNNYNTFVSKIQ